MEGDSMLSRRYPSVLCSIYCAVLSRQGVRPCDTIGVNCSHAVQHFSAECLQLVRPALQPDIDQQNPVTIPRCVTAGCARTLPPWQRHTALTATRRRRTAPPQPVACKQTCRLVCFSTHAASRICP